MSKRTASLLSALNLTGVLVLAVFCALQWQREAANTREINALLKTKHDNEITIRELRGTTASLERDLAQFKQHYADTSAELEKCEASLRDAKRDNARLTQDCEQLKDNIKVWEAAVKERDQRIVEAISRLKEFSEQLQASIIRYNDLATKYNALVARENKTRQDLAQAYKDLNTTRRKLYQALGRPLPPSSPETEPEKNDANNDAT
ncbi:MAG: hypothetical protein LBD01_03175 [Puniceicoccales bacterium]|jgi:chromosome segregation ATPase|nr:hypothetical protein [Puniceicoccales bacterium]